jgi:DNA-binding transcriptional LysR family regulator
MRANPGQLAGRVRMTAPATLGMFAIAGTVARFQEANPAITVEMILSDRRLDLVSDGLDFAIRIGDLQNSSLIARQIGTYRLTLVASPAHLLRYGAPTTPKDLETARCLINLNMSPRNRWPFFRNGETAYVDVDGGLQTDNGVALQYATREGAGIAYLPLHLVEADLNDGRLVEVLTDWEKLSQPVHFVNPSRHQPRRVSALLAEIEQALRLLP